jgi:hypothetical protein
LRLRHSGRLLAASLLLALAHPAAALEYRSTGRPALLYDAPSTHGRQGRHRGQRPAA